MSVEWLLDLCRGYGKADCIVHDESTAGYEEFVAEVATWQNRLAERSVAPGAVVGIVSDFTLSACALLLALIENGNMVVPLMPVTYARRKEFLDIAGVAHVFKPDLDEYVKRDTTAARHPLYAELDARGEAGLVLFSSGSTGAPKAALHSFPNLLEKFKTRRPALRTLTFLLLDHIGGINTFFHTVSNGGTVVSTTDRSPEAVCGLIEKCKIELLPVSPTFLNLLLLSGAYKDHDLSALKIISYGTEPMPQSTLDRLSREFPGVRLLQTYGLSEVGIFRSKSESNDSLWFKIGGDGFETKIVDGILWVRSKSSILGYLNHESPFDADGWMNTGDEVEVKGEYIRIRGRKKEVINVGGEKVYPIEVESALLELDNIQDAIVYAEPSPILGQMVVATVKLVDPEPAAELKSRVRRTLKGKLEPFKVPQKIVVSDENQFNERFKRMRLMRREGEDVVGVHGG